MRTLAILACWIFAASASSQTLTLVDDRGRLLDEPVEVCFVRGLTTDCEEPMAVAEVDLRPFDLLRIEGPRHGPLTVRPGEFDLAREPDPRLAVPRKVGLRINGLPEGPATLSLYAVDDPETRKPRFRFELAGHGTESVDLFVPAGRHLASISRRGFAPDLHALLGEPGETLALAYRERVGWSLALRAVDPATERPKPVPGAIVEISPPPGYAPEALGPRTERTGPLGFAIFGGLEPTMVHAAVRHESFVKTEVLGLSAPRGAFDFRIAGLERGGSIEARVLVSGEPSGGAACRWVEDVGRDERHNPIIATRKESTTGSDGVCRIDHVPAGDRYLRVVLPHDDEAAVVDRNVQVIEGQTTEVGLDLSPIELSGTVYRGEEAAGAGYEILVVRVFAEGPARTEDPVLRTKTDENGDYSGTLWEAGDYAFLVTGPTRYAGSSLRAYLSAPTEQQDFHLAAREISGRVVSSDDAPVSDAAVTLIWNRRSHTGQRVGAEGEFSFSLPDEAGEAALHARQPWSPPGETVRLEIAPGTPIPPVTLTVPADRRVEGRLTSAGGVGVAGGQVWSYRIAETGVPILLGRATTEVDGTFALPLAPAASTSIYASGPGCPLGLQVVPPPADGERVTIGCADAAATLRLHLLDGEGNGLTDRSLLIRVGGLVVPGEVLADHLGSLGLPPATDARGRLIVALLAPGDYDLYLRDSSNEFTIAQGLRHGHVASTALAPYAVTELEIVVDSAFE